MEKILNMPGLVSGMCVGCGWAVLVPNLCFHVLFLFRSNKRHQNNSTIIGLHGWTGGFPNPGAGSILPYPTFYSEHQTDPLPCNYYPSGTYRQTGDLPFEPAS